MESLLYKRIYLLFTLVLVIITATGSASGEDASSSPWDYQVIDPITGEACLDANFELTFAAEYWGRSASKEYLATATAHLPTHQYSVHGSCGEWTSQLQVQWEDGSYILILNFRKENRRWFVSGIQFLYNVGDSNYFPNAVGVTGSLEKSSGIVDSTFGTEVSKAFSCESRSLMLTNTQDKSYKVALQLDNLQLLPFCSPNCAQNASSFDSTHCIQDVLPPPGTVDSGVAVSVAAVCAIGVLCAIVTGLVYTRVKRQLTGYGSFSSTTDVNI